MTDTCIVCLGDLGQSDIHPPAPAPLSPISNEKVYKSEEELSDPILSTKPLGQDLGAEKIAHLLPCGHYLHDACLKPWVERANSCPICRQNFNIVELCDAVGGPITSSYDVSDRVQAADIDPGMFMDDVEEESTPCPRCGLDDNEDVLLLCDGCNAAYHTYCVDLDTVPTGHWFCEDCAAIQATPAVDERPRVASHHPTNRRTRGQLRRLRTQDDTTSSNWARVWQTVWDRLNIDLDFPWDEPTQRRRSSTSSAAIQRRDPYRAWERRLHVAERQSGSHRFRDTAHTLLDRPTISRPRPEPPVPESTEEILAWNAFEKARTIKEPTPKSRKRNSATASPSEPESNPRKRKRRSATSSPTELPAPQPQRRLKRPNTRRAPELLTAAESSAESSRTRQRSLASIRGANSPEAVNVVGPSFLQSLLKEVESSAIPDELRSAIKANGNGSDHPSPQAVSPGSSPTTSNHPSPIACSTTPPPPLSPRSLSPAPLTSRVEPLYPPAPDLSAEPPPILQQPDPKRQRRMSRSQTRMGSRAMSSVISSSPPRPRSEEASPTRLEQISVMKDRVQRMVREALKLPYHNKQISKDQYTNINRNVSRLLYERVGDNEIDDESNDIWQKVAHDEVERELANLGSTSE